jgi:hypothetical protein
VSARAWILLTLAASLAAAPAAQAKLQVTLAISNRIPAVKEPVRAVITTEPAQAHCRMRLLAVAPKVDIYKALNALAIRPSPRLGFYVRLARTSPKQWRGTVRFGRTGLWKLVIPNWCVGGYAQPPPIIQRVSVHAPGP